MGNITLLVNLVILRCLGRVSAISGFSYVLVQVDRDQAYVDRDPLKKKSNLFLLIAIKVGLIAIFHKARTL